MISKIQIADSRLVTVLSANLRLRMSQGGRKGPEELDSSVGHTGIGVRLLYRNASTLQGVATYYSNSPEGYTVFVHDLREDRLRLTGAIPVRIDTHDSAVTAYNPDIEAFGVGDTEAEALDDFRSAVGDLYFLLKEEGEENLGPIPRRQLQYLRSILTEE